MIRSLTGSLSRIVANPFLLLPGIATIAIFFGLVYFFAPFAIDMLMDTIFLDVMPDSTLNALPFHFTALHFTQIVGLGLFGLLSGILFTGLNYWYAAYIRMGFREKASIGKCCSETVSALGKILAFTLFVSIIALFFGVLLWIAAMISIAIPILGIVLILLLVLVFAYLYIKLIFVVQALALEKGTIKQAFEQAWAFSKGKFGAILLFVIALIIVGTVLESLAATASGFFLDDLIGVVIIGIFWSVSLAYSATAMALYYAEKKLGKSI